MEIKKLEKLEIFTRKKYRLYICERCVTESDQDISDELIKRSIENKIQNYEQSLKTNNKMT